MGYFIELSFDIIKTPNFISLKESILKLGEKYKKEFSYNNHEIMGKNRVIYRNHYVMSFLFDDEEKNIKGFIREIKDFKYVNIECIGYDNCIFKLMYASKKYLNIMEKCKAKEYLQKKRENTLFKNNSCIMEEFYKK
tara:strand:- start:140 stop:550 length:411 start_codon:yes stop_codon:yes gene_type:complete